MENGMKMWVYKIWTCRNIEKFLDGWPDKKRGGKSIVSLLKLNKARKKMRAALGMTMDMSVEEVMEGYWILGNFLEQGEIKKQKVHKDVKKRKALLAKYKSRVNRFNSKINSSYGRLKVLADLPDNKCS